MVTARTVGIWGQEEAAEIPTQPVAERKISRAGVAGPAFG
jgi:hypothetical protein